LVGEPAWVSGARSQITIERPGPCPFSLVSWIEGDAPHFDPGRSQFSGKAMEEWAMWSLQEKENTPGPNVHLCSDSFRQIAFLPLTEG